MKIFERSTKVVRPLEYDDGSHSEGPPIIFMEFMERGDLEDRKGRWTKVYYHSLGMSFRYIPYQPFWVQLCMYARSTATFKI
jgi:hypothetical protein